MADFNKAASKPACVCVTPECTCLEMQPTTTLAEMRRMLGRCSAGLLQDMPADAAGELLRVVDRPLMLARVSTGLRAAVLGANPRAPLAYAVDTAKYHASTSLDKNGEVLADLAAKCGTYDVVSIRVSKLHRLLTDATGLSALLPRCPNLTALDVSGNDLRMATLTGLRACTALTALDLSWIPDVGTDTRWLAEELPATLRTLHLKEVNLDTEATMHRLQVALSATPGLTYLDLEHNRFMTSASLAGLLARLPALQRLNLNSTGMDMENMLAVAVGLQSCTGLTHLELSDLWRSDTRRWGPTANPERIQAQNDAGEAFMDMLRSWPALTCLDLSGMNLGRDATFFAASLPALPALTSLLLGDCRVGAQGTINVAAALAGLPRLAHLDMRRCATGDPGAQALVAALPQCQALALLNLGGNKITSAGVEGLAAAVAQCPKLTELDLRPSEVDEETRDAIVGAWRAQHEPRGDCTWTSRDRCLTCSATHFAGPGRRADKQYLRAAVPQHGAGADGDAAGAPSSQR